MVWAPQETLRGLDAEALPPAGVNSEQGSGVYNGGGMGTDSLPPTGPFPPLGAAPPAPSTTAQHQAPAHPPAHFQGQDTGSSFRSRSPWQGRSRAARSGGLPAPAPILLLDGVAHPRGGWGAPDQHFPGMGTMWPISSKAAPPAEGHCPRETAASWVAGISPQLLPSGVLAGAVAQECTCLTGIWGHDQELFLFVLTFN